jgi:hypothetical protein
MTGFWDLPEEKWELVPDINRKGCVPGGGSRGEFFKYDNAHLQRLATSGARGIDHVSVVDEVSFITGLCLPIEGRSLVHGWGRQ